MASGNIVHCDVNELSFTRFVKRGATADRTTLLQWAPFDAALAGRHRGVDGGWTMRRDSLRFPAILRQIITNCQESSQIKVFLKKIMNSQIDTNEIIFF